MTGGKLYDGVRFCHGGSWAWLDLSEQLWVLVMASSCRVGEIDVGHGSSMCCRRLEYPRSARLHLPRSSLDRLRFHLCLMRHRSGCQERWADIIVRVVIIRLVVIVRVIGGPLRC